MNIHTGTVRQADTIRLFRKHLSDVGLESEQVFATILGPNDLVINNHEVRTYKYHKNSKRSILQSTLSNCNTEWNKRIGYHIGLFGCYIKILKNNLLFKKKSFFKSQNK